MKSVWYVISTLCKAISATSYKCSSTSYKCSPSSYICSPSSYRCSPRSYICSPSSYRCSPSSYKCSSSSYKSSSSPGSWRIVFSVLRSASSGGYYRDTTSIERGCNRLLSRGFFIYLLKMLQLLHVYIQNTPFPVLYMVEWSKVELVATLLVATDCHRIIRTRMHTMHPWSAAKTFNSGRR